MHRLDVVQSDMSPDEDERREPDSRPSRLRGLFRFAVDHLVPVLAAAALNLAPRYGYFTLLPLAAGFERSYGNFALLLGSAAALVASVTFSREENRFDIPAFLSAAGGGLITVIPSILARAGLTFGLPSQHFNILIIFAYLGSSIVIGLIVGGCWSVAVKSVRDSRVDLRRDWPNTRPGQGRW